MIKIKAKQGIQWAALINFMHLHRIPLSRPIGTSLVFCRQKHLMVDFTLMRYRSGHGGFLLAFPSIVEPKILLWAATNKVFNDLIK